MQYHREILFGVLFVIVAFSVATSISRGAKAGEIQLQTITPAGSHSSEKRTATFTGDVRLDLLFPPKDAAQYAGAYVTFEPGARTHWHIHPAGQHIIVVSGIGRTAVWGGSTKEIKPGDVIWCPPGVKHWHGASPTIAMTHLVITGMVDGKSTEWMEEVTDGQYAQ